MTTNKGAGDFDVAQIQRHRYWLMAVIGVFGLVLTGGIIWGVDGVIGVGTAFFLASCALQMVNKEAFPAMTARMRAALTWALSR